MYAPIENANGKGESGEKALVDEIQITSDDQYEEACDVLEELYRRAHRTRNDERQIRRLQSALNEYERRIINEGKQRKSDLP